MILFILFRELNHPNVLRLLGLFVSNNDKYIVTEVCGIFRENG